MYLHSSSQKYSKIVIQSMCAAIEIWILIGRLHQKPADLEPVFKRRNTVKPVLSGHSKRTRKVGFQYRLSLNAGQRYCRMLQGEHSAIPSTSNKLPFSIKTMFLSIFKWPLNIRQVLLYNFEKVVHSVPFGSKMWCGCNLRHFLLFHCNNH